MAAPTDKPGDSPWQQPRSRRMLGVLLFAVVLVGGVLKLSTVGLAEQTPPLAGVVTMLGIILGGAAVPLLYLLAAFGWGRLGASLLARGSSAYPFIQLACGLGTMLFLSHLMGVLGLLSEHGWLARLGGAWLPRIAGWAAVAAGLAMLADQVGRPTGRYRPEKWGVFPVGAVVWAPGLAIMLIAACNPPGSLWASEFGAYDVMEYHLQLPKEWAAGAALWPARHNVYSFLPSYMEAAYLHLGALSFGLGGDPSSAVGRMLGGEGTWVHSCQFLHVLVGLVAAMLSGRVATALAARVGADPAVARAAGLASGAVVLATPWTVVVGSLAYNDLAVLAMLAGALLAAVDPDITPGRKGLLVGALMGIACSAKPTALFVAAPAAGIVLLASIPRRAWLSAIGLGAAAGLAGMLPWLIRNAAAAAGNPVFPFATRLFGRAHWSLDQVQRYTQAHFFDGSLGQRLMSLFGTHGLRATEQARGFGHHQWAFIPLLAAVSLAIAVLWRRSRPSGLLLLAALGAQVAGWMCFTHLQSRFLIPLLAPMSAAFGIAAAAIAAWASHGRPGVIKGGWRPRAAAIVIMLIPLSAAGWSLLNFIQQLGERPNRLLVAGVGGLTGEIFRDRVLAGSDQERARQIAEAPSPAVYFNYLRLHAQIATGAAATPPGSQSMHEARSVLLLGDATPLYMLDAAGQNPEDGAVITYHTTWDVSPLGEAIRAAPDDPPAWTAHLRQRGFGSVLVNRSELRRLIERNHYFDRDVTMERLAAWLTHPASGAKSVKRWESGEELYMLTGEVAASDRGTR